MMTKPDLSPEQQTKLENICKLAQGMEEKLDKLDKLTAAIAQKWEQRRARQFSLEWNEQKMQNIREHSKNLNENESVAKNEKDEFF